jgi:16S rRNA (uracil1498-N3)-methyltransferase
VGERILLGDGRGGVALAEVLEVGRDELSLRILDRQLVPAPTPRVTLAQALVKGERGELAVELATEAGVDHIVAWRAARCVARWDDGPRGDKALSRWRGTVTSAVKQSRRAWLPEVEPPIGTGALADRCAAADLALVLHEDGAEPIAALSDELSQAREVLLVVGPEGGIGADELAALVERGARATRLGPQVLRASTAAAVALGALGALTHRWLSTEYRFRFPNCDPIG